MMTTRTTETPEGTVTERLTVAPYRDFAGMGNPALVWAASGWVREDAVSTRLMRVVLPFETRAQAEACVAVRLGDAS